MFDSTIYRGEKKQKEIEKFLLENEAYPQQSKAYFDFYKKTEKDVFYCVIENNHEEILLVSLVVQHEKKIKGYNFNYLYTLLGPVIKKDIYKETAKKSLEKFFLSINKYAKKNKSLYFKVYPFYQIKKTEYSIPFIPNKNSVQEILNKNNSKKSKFYHFYQETSILNIKSFNNSEDFLDSIKSKWRYNVRLAKKKGIKIKFSKDLKYFDDYYHLTKITAERNNFNYWSKDRSKKYVKAIFKNNIGEWGIAEDEGKILSIILLLKYGNLAIYIRGASSNECREKMPNHLLHYEVVKKLIKEKISYYDFWGVSTDKNDPLNKGVTRFKFGFMPKNLTEEEKVTTFGDACDIEYRKTLCWILKKVKR